MTTYEIQTKYGGEWSNHVGDSNEFATPLEAWILVAELRTLDGEWREAEYRVAEVLA